MMVRSREDEIQMRYERRKKYLEDQNYRKWSDIAPDSCEINMHSINAFAEWRDDVLFCYLIANQSSGLVTSSQLVEYLSYLKNLEIIGDESKPKTSVEELLNRYRDKLLSTYDII